jgi:hypothetical protein
MPKATLTLIAIAVLLAGCNRSQAPSATATTSTSVATSAPVPAHDPIQQKLKEIAGSSALDCGRHEIQAQMDELKTASNCVLDAAKTKKPFYVGYNMPGMTNAIAGNSEGKLFAVQLQGSGTGAQMASGACPAELRIASSGRVTCFTPGSMSLNSGAGGPDPHAGMALNPTQGANPHGGLGIPEPMAPPPSTGKSK